MEEHQGFWYLVGLVAVCFFFSSRRRHTRFDCDWSSDVCSSDLVGGSQHLGTVGGEDLGVQVLAGAQHRQAGDAEIGRASCRERGEISVVAGSLKKKKRKRHRKSSRSNRNTRRLRTTRRPAASRR